MTRKFSVYFQTIASANVSVELSQEDLEQVSVEVDKIIEELTLEDLRELIIEKAYNNTPILSAKGGKWGEKWSFKLGEWKFGLGFNVDQEYDDKDDVTEE